MNEHDSETLAGMLIEKGYVPAAERKDANIVIFNTCSIRENADKRFFGTLGQLKRRKTEQRENFTVCVCGCMMQQQHIIDTIKAKYPWVDVIFGTHNLHQLPELLDNLYKEKHKQLAIWEEGGEIVQAQGVCEYNVWLQQLLHLLHRSIHKRKREKQNSRGHPERSTGTRSRWCKGNHAFGSECELLQRKQQRKQRKNGFYRLDLYAQ